MKRRKRYLLIREKSSREFPQMLEMSTESFKSEFNFHKKGDTCIKLEEKSRNYK